MQKTKKRQDKQQLSAVLLQTTYDKLNDIAKDEYLSLAALVRKVLACYVKSKK